MRLTDKPTYEDLLAVRKAATFNRISIGLLILMGVVTVVTLLSLALGWINVPNNQLLLYLFPPAMYVFFLIYTPYNLRKAAREDAEKLVERSWRITAKGITVHHGDQTTSHTWEDFAFYQELDGQFLLFFKENRSKYIFLSKAAFSNQEQMADFQALLNTHLKKIK